MQNAIITNLFGNYFQLENFRVYFLRRIEMEKITKLDIQFGIEFYILVYSYGINLISMKNGKIEIKEFYKKNKLMDKREIIDFLYKRLNTD